MLMFFVKRALKPNFTIMLNYKNSPPQKQMKVSQGKQEALITNMTPVLLYHVYIYRKKFMFYVIIV